MRIWMSALLYAFFHFLIMRLAKVTEARKLVHNKLKRTKFCHTQNKKNEIHSRQRLPSMNLFYTDEVHTPTNETRSPSILRVSDVTDK